MVAPVVVRFKEGKAPKGYIINVKKKPRKLSGLIDSTKFKSGLFFKKRIASGSIIGYGFNGLKKRERGNVAHTIPVPS